MLSIEKKEIKPMNGGIQKFTSESQPETPKIATN